MNAEQLRALQAPLKDTYRNDAHAAWELFETLPRRCLVDREILEVTGCELVRRV